MLYLLVLLVVGGLVAWWAFDVLGIGHRITRKGKYDEKRSSSRQGIPQVLVELRRSIDSETPDWVYLAVDNVVGNRQRMSYRGSRVRW